LPLAAFRLSVLFPSLFFALHVGICDRRDGPGFAISALRIRKEAIG
jgi:hypothetical protein